MVQKLKDAKLEIAGTIRLEITTKVLISYLGADVTEPQNLFSKFFKYEGGAALNVAPVAQIDAKLWNHPSLKTSTLQT